MGSAQCLYFIYRYICMYVYIFVTNVLRFYAYCVHNIASFAHTFTCSFYSAIFHFIVSDQFSFSVLCQSECAFFSVVPKTQRYDKLFILFFRGVRPFVLTCAEKLLHVISFFRERQEYRKITRRSFFEILPLFNLLLLRTSVLRLEWKGSEFCFDIEE